MRMFETPSQLAAWLAEHGVDTAVWGQSSHKSITDLWQEIEAGESVLQAGPVRRLVRVAEVIVRQGDRMLVEMAQELADGRIRQRHLPPSEKIKPDEDVVQAARRCLAEEVGLPPAQVEVLSITALPERPAVSSPSYPGLMTRYAVYRVETAVTGLPAAPFWHENQAASAHDPVKRHRWDWAPPDRDA